MYTNARTTVIAIATLWGLALGPQLGWSASAQIKSAIVGLKVVDDRFPTEAFEFSPFHGNAGTQLLVMLASPEKQIVGVLHRESSVDLLVGSSGTDLLQEQAQEPSPFSHSSSRVGMFPRLSKNGRLAVVELNGPRAPQAEDVHVDVKAEIKLILAAKQETVTLRDTALEPQDLDVPGHKVSLLQAGPKENWNNEEKFTVVVQIDGDTLGAIAEIEFLDADGEVIEVQGGSSMSIGERRTSTFPLAREVANATIRLQIWRGVETVSVPIATRQSLGL